jgi:hypothetical protein
LRRVESRLAAWWRRVDERITDGQVWGLLILAVLVLAVLGWAYVALLLEPALHAPPERR